MSNPVFCCYEFLHITREYREIWLGKVAQSDHPKGSSGSCLEYVQVSHTRMLQLHATRRSLPPGLSNDAHQTMTLDAHAMFVRSNAG